MNRDEFDYSSRPTQQELDKAKDVAIQMFKEHFEGHSEEGLLDAWQEMWEEAYPDRYRYEGTWGEEVEEEIEKWRTLISTKVDAVLASL